MKKYIVLLSKDSNEYTLRRLETKFDRNPGDKMYIENKTFTVLTSPVTLSESIEIYNFQAKRIKEVIKSGRSISL